MIEFRPTGEAEARVWATALELADLFSGLPWILIGAQMVMLLEREAGRPGGRTTVDVDVVIDVRLLADGAQVAAARLVAAGFAPSVAGQPHRFMRGDAQVDLLAPDNLGGRARLNTVARDETVGIPGASQALRSSRRVDVRVSGVGSGNLPIPTLAGAIVLKLRAWQARRAPRDLEDLVRLLSLVRDVEETRHQLKPAERRALGKLPIRTDPAHPAWRATTGPYDALLALDRLAG